MLDILTAVLQALPVIVMWVILAFQNKQILKHKQQIRAIVNVLEKIAEDMKIRAGATK